MSSMSRTASTASTRPLANRTEQKAKQFADYIRKKWNTRVQVYSDANEAVRGADIIVTATNSSAPVFTEPLQPGVHVNAVGSFRPAMQELPSHVMSQADSVVVESREAALEETGDCLYVLHLQSARVPHGCRSA